MSVWTGFNKTLENGEASFVGQDEHITPQWFFRDIMQSISTYNGQDFARPDSVVQVNGNELAVRGNEGLQSTESGRRQQQNTETEKTVEEPSQVITESEEEPSTQENTTEPSTQEETTEEPTEETTSEPVQEETTEEPTQEEATEERTEEPTSEPTEEQTEEAAPSVEEPVEEQTEEETDEAA
ncbi:hypothetical protein [Salinicoccus sp. CNSTN-B1]